MGIEGQQQQNISYVVYFSPYNVSTQLQNSPKNQKGYIYGIYDIINIEQEEVVEQKKKN